MPQVPRWADYLIAAVFVAAAGLNLVRWRQRGASGYGVMLAAGLICAAGFLLDAFGRAALGTTLYFLGFAGIIGGSALVRRSRGAR